MLNCDALHFEALLKLHINNPYLKYLPIPYQSGHPHLETTNPQLIPDFLIFAQYIPHIRYYIKKEIK